MKKIILIFCMTFLTCNVANGIPPASKCEVAAMTMGESGFGGAVIAIATTAVLAGAIFTGGVLVHRWLNEDDSKVTQVQTQQVQTQQVQKAQIQMQDGTTYEITISPELALKLAAAQKELTN